MRIAWLLLGRFSLRHWRLAPGQNALLILILSVGVGVFVAIRLANHAAVASFGNFAQVLIGQSDWVVEAPVGTLPESILPELRDALGERPVALVPVVETTGGRPFRSDAHSELDRETVTLLGIDLVAISNLESERASAGGYLVREGSDVWGELAGAPRTWVAPALAGEKSIALIVDDKVVDFSVAGVIPEADGAPPPPDNLMVVDLPQLQRLCNKTGRIDRVEFVVAPGPGIAERRVELGALLGRLGEDGKRWLVRAAGARRETAEAMTEAFRLNLTILSLIALLVGLYLIFQALDGAVVRRRGEIATLRSLGLDEFIVRRVWIVESAVLGLAGGTVGLALGWLGAQGAVRVVGHTVNALYFATTVSSAALDPQEAWIGLALGVGASVAAGWLPAREAARTPPAQVLVRSGAPAPGSQFWRRPWVALAIVAFGVVLSKLPPLRLAGGVRFPLAGYAAALSWIFGGGMICAASLPVIGRLLRAWLPGPAPARVASGHILRPSGRHRIATAAVVCAVGMSAGMAILVASFEETVRGWVARSLQADVYLYSAGTHSAAAANRIAPETWRALASHPGVAQVWALAAYPFQYGSGAPTLLTGTEMALVRERSSLPWVEAPRDEAVFDPERNAGLAVVSECFSDRFEKHRGDTVDLPTPSGTKRVRIAGIFADYGNERGSILVERTHLAQWMSDDSATHISLFVKPGVNPDALRAALRKEYPGLQVFTNSTLRGEILRIFRQTFSITYALEVIGVIVAVAGMALTMASVLLDRRDELTTLRAIGFAKREIALSASIEGLAVAAWASVGGLALSLALGWLLIHVINKQSFGWTLGFTLPWSHLAWLALAVASAGWTVSYAVGAWSSNLPADQEE